MQAKWIQQLAELENESLVRTLRIAGPGPLVQTPNGEKLVFCSNDYLGMATNSLVANEAALELSKGLGMGSSRLVSGNSDWHERLERRFAGFVQKESSVLFPSGYQANVGTIGALATKNDVIFSDALCHASIIDGCRLSSASVEIYAHNDVADLSRLLKEYKGFPGGKLVITEGVFSMDGDVPALQKICETAKSAGAAVYVDEAHSLGIMGPNGRGLAAQLGVQNDVDILVGTFGKAMGGSGAAVACSATVSQLLKSKARSLLYTTAPPACLSRALLKSFEIVEAADEIRAKLNRNIQQFKMLAKQSGISLLPSDSPIQPVPIGSASTTMAISGALWEQGIFVQGIRAPTVPVGTERLRVTLTANHTQAQIEQFIEQLQRHLKKFGVGHE